VRFDGLVHESPRRIDSSDRAHGVQETDLSGDHIAGLVIGTSQGIARPGPAIDLCSITIEPEATEEMFAFYLCSYCSKYSGRKAVARKDHVTLYLASVT
jgi:hypothetical protein